MIRKLLIIIVILFVAALVIFGISWFASRRSATQNGTTPPSFKTFFNLAVKRTPPSSTPSDGTSSEFTSGTGSTTSGTVGQGSAGGTPSTIGGAGESVEVSQFTTTTISPGASPFGTSSTIGGGSAIGGGSTINGSPLGGSNPSSGGVPSTTGTASIVPSLSCSSEDTNIIFTESELARLSALQARFNDIADILYTDQDVQAEFENYDGFKIEEAQVQEMTMLCRTITASLPANLQRKVPTPYWRDSATDVDTFTWGVPFTGELSVVNNDQGKAVLERILRINFW